MPFLLNGVTVDTVVLNGSSVDELYMNGVLVFQSIRDRLLGNFNPTDIGWGGSGVSYSTSSPYEGTHCIKIAPKGTLRLDPFDYTGYSTIEMYLRSPSGASAYIYDNLVLLGSKAVNSSWGRMSVNVAGRGLGDIGIANGSSTNDLYVDYIWARV